MGFGAAGIQPITTSPPPKLVLDTEKTGDSFSYTTSKVSYAELDTATKYVILYCNKKTGEVHYYGEEGVPEVYSSNVANWCSYLNRTFPHNIYTAVKLCPGS